MCFQLVDGSFQHHTPAVQYLDFGPARDKIRPSHMQIVLTRQDCEMQP